MKKTKTYKETRFTAETLENGITAVNEMAERLEAKRIDVRTLEVQNDDSKWEYDHVDEFLADYRRYKGSASCRIFFDKVFIMFSVFGRETSIVVEAPQRVDVESIFNVFEKNAATAKLKPLPRPPAPSPVVFIGHGRSPIWRDLKDHLHDKHGIKVEAYETGARAGHTIRDILEDMASKSTFALLVLTAEDEQADGTFRARQNVIHEAGIFQGRLGFSRAILLLEEEVEAFSNVQGVQYIRFSKNNIKETFGEVLATIRREFGAKDSQ